MERVRHRQKYLSDFVFPFLGALSLLRLTDAQWIAIADKLQIIAKQLELEAFHHPLSAIQEFLDCLVVNYLFSRSMKEESSEEEPVMRNGLRLSEVSEMEELKEELNEEEIRVDVAEKRKCEALMLNQTSETQRLYEVLIQNTSLPSLKLRQDASFMRDCYCCFAYCCHHLSLVPLYGCALFLNSRVWDYMEFLSTTTRSCPTMLRLLWRSSVMSLLSHHVSTELVAYCTLHVTSMFSLVDANKPNASMSIENDDYCASTLPLSIHMLYALPRSKASVGNGARPQS